MALIVGAFAKDVRSKQFCCRVRGSVLPLRMSWSRPQGAADEPAAESFLTKCHTRWAHPSYAIGAAELEAAMKQVHALRNHRARWRFARAAAIFAILLCAAVPSGASASAVHWFSGGLSYDRGFLSTSTATIYYVQATSNHTRVCVNSEYSGPISGYHYGTTPNDLAVTCNETGMTVAITDYSGYCCRRADVYNAYPGAASIASSTHYDH